MKKHYYVFNFIAISCYALVVILNLFISNGEYSEQENRYLQGAPTLSAESVANRTFMEDIENYSSDQMLFRNFFVSTKAKCEKLLGKNENNGVYFASHEYLIEKPEEVSAEIINNNIKSITEVSKHNRYKVSACIIPQAFEIHKDKLPKGAYNLTVNNLLKTFSQSLKGYDVKVVDPTKTLTQNKDNYIFYRTDHHQTSKGSFLVYKDLGKALGYSPLKESDFTVETVSDKFLGTTYSKVPVSVTPDVISVYKTKINQNARVEFYGENKESETIYFNKHLAKKDKYSYFLDGNHSVTIIKGGKKDGETLAIFKDSYSHSIAPFLINHFETIHLLDMRYFQDDPIKYLDENKISNVLFLYGSSTFMTDSTIASVSEYAKASAYVTKGLVPKSKAVNNSYFDDAVFIGDSLSVCLQSYSGLDNATFLCRTSMSVGGVFNIEEDGTSLVDKLKAAKPKKIYIMLGVNELLIPSNKEAVMSKYEYLIDNLKKDNPEAIIYIQSILPYSKAKSDSGRIKNDVIFDYNKSLLKMAEEKEVYYIDVYKAIVDKDNAMRSELTSDGTHLDKEGCVLWTDYLKTHAITTAEDFKEEESDNQKTEAVFANGDYELNSICQKLKDAVIFEGDVGSTSVKALLKTHKIDEKIITNAIGMVGGGATAEEIALFETKNTDDAKKLEIVLKDYVASRIKSFESYIPAEVPKLNNAIIYTDGKFVALIVAKDIGSAKEILGSVTSK